MSSRSFRGHPAPRKRRADTIAPREQLAVVSDGETEIAYVRQAVATRRLSSRVDILDDFTGLDALTLIRQAKAVFKGNYGPRSNFRSRPDQVWVLCDVESPPHDKTSRKIPDAVQTARDNDGIELVLTCPCIEVWLLLHQTDLGPLDSAKKAKSQMAKQQPGYDGPNVAYSALHPFEKNASRRAARLEHIAEGVWDHNPSTGMHRFIARLDELASKS